MNYIEELQKEEWFAKLPPSTQASIGIALGEVDRRAREEAIKKTVECFDTHDEGFGSYCDTGADMDWACRSECTEHGKERARRYYKSLTPNQ